MGKVSYKLRSEKTSSAVKITVISQNFKMETKNVTPSMNQLKIMKNVLIICLGFFFLYLPFQSLASLQTTLNIVNNTGIISQIIISMSVILSAIFLPKLIIMKFGCKITLILCMLAYVPYFAANFYPHLSIFIPAAILLGVASAPLWTAKCTYISEISVLYAAGGSDTEDVITSRFMGIFFTMYQNTQIWGNLISFLVLKPHDSESDLNKLESFSQTANTINPGLGLMNLTCGAHSCNDVNENLLPPSDDKRYMLVSVYVCSALISAIIVFLFLDPITPCVKGEAFAENEVVFSHISSTLKHLKNVNQLLVVPLTIFHGMQQGFLLSDYSKAFVACPWGVHNVGLVFIWHGVVNAILSFFSGHLVKYVPRAALFIVGALGNAGACTALLLWQPQSEEFIYSFVLAGVWGMSDAVWFTQINALYAVLFREDEEAAFANFKIWESTGFSLSFGFSIFLCTDQKIYILLIFLIIGIAGYITVEIRNYNRKKTDIFVPP